MLFKDDGCSGGSPSGSKPFTARQAVASQNCHSVHISPVDEAHEEGPHPTIPTARRSLVRREEPPHATPRSPPVRSALAGSLENNRGGRPPRVENNWRNTLEPLPRRATGPVLSGREQPD